MDEMYFSYGLHAEGGRQSGSQAHRHTTRQKDRQKDRQMQSFRRKDARLHRWGLGRSHSQEPRGG